jgi:tetratricopeptide (TPR) repeat protein
MTKRVSTARTAFGGLLVAALGCVALAAGLGWPASALAAQQVSKEFFDKFKPAQDALQRRDYATALRAAKESVGAAKNATEKEYALKVRLSAAFGAQNWADASSAAEQLIALDGVSGAEKNNYRRMLGQIAEQQRQYDRAIQYTQEAMKGGATTRDYELLFRVYAIRGDCTSAMANLDRALAGKPANETQLKARNSCLFKQNNTAARAPVAEELLRRFPKKTYFTDVVSLYAEQKLDERAMLNVYRWGFDKDLIEREADYLAYVDAAMNAGASAEAARVLERGVKSGVVKTGDPNSRTARLVVSTNKIAADDKAKLAQLDKEARAGKSGESDAAVGLAHFGAGEYGKAVEALQRAFQPDRANRIKRPDDANMVLGISLLKTGKRAESDKAFNAAKADPRMAKAASLWLGGK